MTPEVFNVSVKWVDPSMPVEGQEADVLALDADLVGLEEAISWAREYHEKSLAVEVRRAYDQGRPDTPERAVLFAATVVILAFADRLPKDAAQVTEEAAAVGAVLYIKPSALEQGNTHEHFEQEIAQAFAGALTYENQFLVADATGTGTPAEEAWDTGAIAKPPAGTPPDDLSIYVDPAYRLSETDFDALLRRGHEPDPRATGD